MRRGVLLSNALGTGHPRSDHDGRVIDPDLEKAAHDALAARGIKVCHPVAVRLHTSRDAAWDEMYWLCILGDGGVPVAPLLVNDAVPMLDQFGVVTKYLRPDRDTDERDAPATAQVLRLVRDIALAYAEADGTALVPMPSDLVLSRGVLHVAGIDGVERR